MGLDMYLTASRYLSQFSEQEQAIAASTAKLLGVGWRVRSVDIEVMYWRKANAIHKWFVDNVQDGDDDCGEHYVPMGKLLELHALCRAALAKKEEREILLPPQEGFFFGGTDIDDAYWNDIEETAKALEKIISAPEFQGHDWAFAYHSSW